LRDISESIERIDLGTKNRITMNPKEKEMTAYHETGHLITTYLLHPRSDVFKASIIPRKSSLGVVHPTPIEEWHSHDRETLLADIQVALSGYAGEKVKYGTTTNGVTSDFRKAMALAHHMVWICGMGPSGLIGDYTAVPKEQLSEETKIQLNRDVDAIIKQCLKDVEDLLKKEHDLFERFAHELITRGEIDYDEIEAIFAEYGKANPRKFVSSQADSADPAPREKESGHSEKKDEETDQ